MAASPNPPGMSDPPTPPQRSDSGNFSTRADAFLTWLGGVLVNEMTAALNWVRDAMADTKSARDASSSSASAASTKAGEAGSSASAAASSASAAATSASTASTKAGEAGSSASAAAGSASAAATSASTANSRASEANASAISAASSAASAAASATNAGYAGVTSTTSVAMATGNLSFVVNAVRAYTPSLPVRVVFDVANYMEGTISTISGNTITVNVSSVVGSGTRASWTFALIQSADAPTKSGAGASGTWSISISGNAGTASAVAWGGVSGKPTTVTGYGITDMGSQSVSYADSAGKADTAVSTGFGGGSVSTNLANGGKALASNTTGYKNTASGFWALASNMTGYSNTAIGSFSLAANISGYENVAIGVSALTANTSGYDNIAIGNSALYVNTIGSNNTAIGFAALRNIGDYDYCTGLGSRSSVTGSYQVQLGDPFTTAYVYGTVQNRSDLRDKADVRDTNLGLDFILSLRPVDYRWDMREDYRPDPPVDFPEDATDEQRAEHSSALDAWRDACRLGNVVRDGSKKRTRYHHGLIAQEVKAVMDASGIDFGGYQDHRINGGEDVLSVGYDELIAPLIKAVQDLKSIVDAQADRIARLEGSGSVRSR